MVATRKSPARKPITARQDIFARLIVVGKPYGEAWKEAYRHPAAKNKTAHEAGSRLANDPRVLARVAEIRAKSDGPTLLSLNDRLGKLSAAANFTPKSAADRNALARVIEVYNKTAGDHAPDRQEITHKGDAENPVAVTQVPLSKADKVAALRATRPKKAAP